MSADYYRILQVDPHADPEVVEAAYRRLARKFHPDVSRLADSEQRIRELNLAYAVLGDPLRRADYDRSRLVSPVPVPRPARRRGPGRRTPPPPAQAVRPGPEARRGHRVIAFATVAGLTLALLGAATFSSLFKPDALVPELAESTTSTVFFTRSTRSDSSPSLVRPAPTATIWSPFAETGFPPRAATARAVEPQSAADGPVLERVATLLGDSARRVRLRLLGPTPPSPPIAPVAPE